MKKCSGIGLLCDRKMPAKLKGMVYKTVTRPAMLHGADVSYNEETRKWMDVRSDTQRQDQERTHQMNNEHDAGVQQYHGETIELVGPTVIW